MNNQTGYLQALSAGKTNGTWAVAIATVAALAAFAPSLLHEFVWDDEVLLLPVSAYWSADIKSILFSKANSVEYLPVRDLSLMIDALIWGQNPSGFHLTNILLYLLTLPFVYMTVDRLASLVRYEEKQSVAFWTTLFFAIHPLHVEPVAFIAARNNLLAMLFLMLSLTAFLSLSKHRVLTLSGSLMSFGLALFSKASAIFFPFALTLIYLLIPRERRDTLAKPAWLVPFFLITLLAIWVHLNNAQDVGLVMPEMGRFGASNRLFTALTAMQIPWFYFEKALWPYPLSVFYPFPDARVWVGGVLGGLGLLLLVLLCWKIRRRAKLLVIAIGWLLFSLTPVLNLVPTIPVVADRYIYPGSFGLALAAALGVTALTRRWPATRFAAWIPVAIWLVLSAERTMDWRSDVAIFEAEYATHPAAASVAYINALVAAGRIDDALRVDTGQHASYIHHHTLALAAQNRGDTQAVFRHLERALRAGGETDKTVLLSAARLHERAGDPLAAIRYYERVITTPWPDPFRKHKREAERGIEKLKKQLAGKVAAQTSHAKTNPKDMAAQFETGLLLHKLSEYESAISFYRRAIKIQADRWEVWYNLGLAESKIGRYDEAIASYMRVLSLNPGHLNTLIHLGTSSAAKGDLDAAEKHYQRALEIDPGFVDAAFNLGRLYFRRGNSNKAREYFELTLRSAGTDEAIRARIQDVMSYLQ